MNTPIFFSRNHGLVSVSSNELNDLNLSLNATISVADVSVNEQNNGNLTLYNLDPEDMLNAYKDTIGQLKAAFIFYVQNKTNAARDIVEQLFAVDGKTAAGTDTVLDKVVLAICKDLLDDVPAQDPRWRTDQYGLGSSYSMQIANQLKDKQKALNLFIEFLKEIEIWKRLGLITVRDTVLATPHVIGKIY